MKPRRIEARPSRYADYKPGDKVQVTLYKNQGYLKKKIGTRNGIIVRISSVSAWVEYENGEVKRVEFGVIKKIKDE